jgi:hypothetical protein
MDDALNVRFKRDGFVWGRDDATTARAYRSDLPAASRKFEFVSSEEIRRAVVIVVQASFQGTARGSAVRVVSRDPGSRGVDAEPSTEARGFITRSCVAPAVH